MKASKSETNRCVSHYPVSNNSKELPVCIYLPTKIRIVKAMVFPVVMYGSESWTIKKANH